MKSLIKLAFNTSAGVVAGKMIFGLSKQYCGSGFFTGIGTTVLAVSAFACAYSMSSDVMDFALGKTQKKEKKEEDSSNG